MEPVVRARGWSSGCSGGILRFAQRGRLLTFGTTVCTRGAGPLPCKQYDSTASFRRRSVGWSPESGVQRVRRLVGSFENPALHRASTADSVGLRTTRPPCLSVTSNSRHGGLLLREGRGAPRCARYSGEFLRNLDDGLVFRSGRPCAGYGRRAGTGSAATNFSRFMNGSTGSRMRQKHRSFFGRTSGAFCCDARRLAADRYRPF